MCGYITIQAHAYYWLFTVVLRLNGINTQGPFHMTPGRNSPRGETEKLHPCLVKDLLTFTWPRDGKSRPGVNLTPVLKTGVRFHPGVKTSCEGCFIFTPGWKFDILDYTFDWLHPGASTCASRPGVDLPCEQRKTRPGEISIRGEFHPGVMWKAKIASKWSNMVGENFVNTMS